MSTCLWDVDQGWRNLNMLWLRSERPSKAPYLYNRAAILRKSCLQQLCSLRLLQSVHACSAAKSGGKP